MTTDAPTECKYCKEIIDADTVIFVQTLFYNKKLKQLFARKDGICKNCFSRSLEVGGATGDSGVK